MYAFMHMKVKNRQNYFTVIEDKNAQSGEYGGAWLQRTFKYNGNIVYCGLGGICVLSAMQYNKTQQF